MSERRPLAARIGIVLLNLIAPGAGLLRLGRLRVALLFLLAPLVALAIGQFALAADDRLGFQAYALLVALTLLAVLGGLVGSMVVSWRASRFRGSARGWWGRWYALAVLVPVYMTALTLANGTGAPRYKTYYIPAESMMPTMAKNDRLVVSLGAPEQLRRGDVIVLAAPAGDYVKRIAALPGDRIAMRDGVVFLNGRPVPQRKLGREATNIYGRAVATRLAERFPGEPREHLIYDLGYYEIDDVAEQLVQPGHVFVLGDNRDMSADSRAPRQYDGVEQLPLSRIRGVALFILWSRERSNIGLELTPPPEGGKS